MKALIVLLALLSTTVAAQHRHFHPHDHFRHHRIHHPHHGWVWVVPTVVGGVVAYELVKQRNELELIRQQQELDKLNKNCGPWIEREVGGQLVRERICEK